MFVEHLFPRDGELPKQLANREPPEFVPAQAYPARLAVERVPFPPIAGLRA